LAETTEQPRILVVEDEASTRAFVSRVLARKGYLVYTAIDGTEALAQANQYAPDLILLDVMLPHTDGYTVCQELKRTSATRDIPVIFLTAIDDAQGMLRGFDVGGVDYIVKPFEVSVLFARVRTHSTLYRLSNRLKLALDERTAHLEQANRRLHELNVEMTLIEARQRQRLAQDLHDTAIQQLVLASIIADDDRNLVARRPQLQELIQGSLQQLRSLVFELSPPMLRQSGLYPALEWLAQQIIRQWGLNVDCDLQGEPVILPEALAVTLFQGVRELLINVAKHADAENAWVSVRFLPLLLEIGVEDDGRGFARSDIDVGGFGLDSLRSRIELLGGSTEIEGRTPRGTRVRLRVPVAQFDASNGNLH
jgi:two-component system sensor histidine kinase/response regulator